MSFPNATHQSPNNGYRHPPLPTNEDAIRILTMSPGEFYDPISCSLAAFAFVNRPRYAALSYTWGLPFPGSMPPPNSPGEAVDSETVLEADAESNGRDSGLEFAATAPKVTKPTRLPSINVNGMAVSVQHNLHLAMLHLRSPTHALSLWIDAICINQEDKVEVSSQVSIMSFIYSRAHMVISWLGPKGLENHSDLFHHMSNLWRMGQSRHLGAAMVQKASVMSRDPEPEAIVRIAASSYWTRLWIVQEVFLARNLIFVYGSDVWTFESFMDSRTLKELQAASEAERKTPSEGYNEFRAMLRLLDSRKRRYSLMNSLESLIETFGAQSCSKVMDRIYGLVGMAYDVHPVSSSEPIPAPIEVDLERMEQQHDANAKLKRGRGVLRIDCSSSLYDLWVEVVKFVFFRAKSRQLEKKLGSNQVFQDQERLISIVRTAGVIQAALDQRVEPHTSSLEDITNDRVAPQPIRIRAIGFLSGKLLHLGPEYSSLLGSFHATQDWFSGWENHYTRSLDLERLHEINDRYTDKVWKYSNQDLERIRDFGRNHHTYAWRLSANQPHIRPGSTRDPGPQSRTRSGSNAPRMFLGTKHLIGLAPPAAQPGDVVVQFWNCDAALVMRPVHTEDIAVEDCIGCSASSFTLVGRADVVNWSREKNTPDSDSWAEDRLIEGVNDSVNGSAGTGAVYVEFDFATLQAVTASIRT